MSETAEKQETNGKAVWDILSDYFKGRIETPFILAFLASWLVLNRNLIFFLIFYKQPDKYTLLATWDFGKPADFFGLGSFENTYTRNLILPAMYAGSFAVVIHPIELLTAAVRYLLSALLKTLAETCKNIYTNSKPFFDLLIKSKKLISKINEQEKLYEISIANVKATKEEIDRYDKLKARYEASFINEMMYKALLFRHEIGEEKLQFINVNELDFDCKIQFLDKNNRHIELFYDQFLKWLVEVGEEVYAFQIATKDATVTFDSIIVSRKSKSRLFSIKQIEKIVLSGYDHI